MKILHWYMDDDDKRIAKNYGKREGDADTIDLRSGTPSGILRSVLIFLFGVFIILSIWKFFAWYYNDYLGLYLLHFPTPEESFVRLYEYFTEYRVVLGYTIYEHLEASLIRWMTAFALAAVAGLALGTVLGCSRTLYPIGMSPVNVIQMIPGMAWLPVAILLFGLGDDAAIFIIFLISFVIITLNVAGGIRRIPEVFIRASDMMGANRLTKVFKVLLPFAALDIISGLRQGMGSAWRVLISAEMLVATGLGIGFAISALRGVLDYIGSFACIVIIGVIGLLVDKVIFVNIEKYARHKLGMDQDV